MVVTILTYIAILLAKITEVSLMTVRMVLITKGERKIGAIIAFFEVLLWVVIVSTVLKDISSDPIKAVVYALGFSLGSYFGSKVEEKIGIGVSEIKAIVKDEHGPELVEHLRSKGFAVTVVEGEGKNQARHILFMYVKRKRVKQVIETLTEHQENAVITVSDTKPVYGGYLIRK
jgi:uncharacterized protein YebE (UPF0316 family)